MLSTRSLHSLDHYHQFHYCYLSIRYQAAIIQLTKKLDVFDSAWQTLSPRVCSSDKMIPLHICMSLKSKVWSMSYHGSVGDEFKTETQLYVFIYFVGILLLLLLLLFLFSIIKFAFLLFSILFLDEASNFRHRILTNQKQKFVVENCQWKCMSQYFLN